MRGDCRRWSTAQWFEELGRRRSVDGLAVVTREELLDLRDAMRRASSVPQEVPGLGQRTHPDDPSAVLGAVLGGIEVYVREEVRRAG